jgi:hypothetical protein
MSTLCSVAVNFGIGFAPATAAPKGAQTVDTSRGQINLADLDQAVVNTTQNMVWIAFFVFTSFPKNTP